MYGHILLSLIVSVNFKSRHEEDFLVKSANTLGPGLDLIIDVGNYIKNTNLTIL